MLEVKVKNHICLVSQQADKKYAITLRSENDPVLFSLSCSDLQSLCSITRADSRDL